MDCKEFERQIPDFINNKMDFMTLNQFEEHMQHCDSCKEELVIQFLVTEGMQRLEKGSTFDLQSELETKINKADRRIRARRRVLWFMYGMEALAILAVILMTILVILK